MNLSVIGCGYVGLVSTAVGFSSRGHTVTCVDVDEKKVDKINSGESPILEQGLEQFLKSCVKEKRINATKLPVFSHKMQGKRIIVGSIEDLRKANRFFDAQL
ncbi:MAG: hypothetical protein KAJ24_00680 [Candidatus Aenigmarchaeota archaeon]|nr:hypothetical protein [Candidatus Aenigmarchaeota archaeon]